MVVINSTFRNNNPSSSGYGGGIYQSGGSVSVYNSTFSANYSLTDGGGIYSEGGGTLSLYNTILANGNSNADCYHSGGTLANDVNNLIENNASGANACGTPVSTADPHLGSLASNGGLTKTFALLAGSPAIDAGNDATCAGDYVDGVDQRGIARPQDGDGNGSIVCDIGSYELPVPNTLPTISNITDKTINEDTPTGIIAFTVGDVETPAASLIVTATSSNTTLVPYTNIALGGSGASRTINITPASNQNGITMITVTVSDGIATANDTFLLTVNAVNDPPIVTSFTANSPSTSLNILITAFTAWDDVSVTGYKITTSSTVPAAGDAGWSGSVLHNLCGQWRRKLYLVSMGQRRSGYCIHRFRLAR